MWQGNRRDFLRTSAAGIAAAGLAFRGVPLLGQDPEPGDRPPAAEGVRVLNPRARAPVSLIIDDSTCLVNLAHFAMPQFARSWPDREDYQKPWRTWPREIPDAFVRKFGEWCAEQGVKGKFSIVPYPACVGWLDRFLPGWSKKDLEDSLDLVRTLMLPNWDIHPEMVSHTRAIDVKTGRPFDDCSERFMENWRFTDGKSVDQMAEYSAYALRILKNAGLPCEGITTPGGYGNRVLPELAQGTLDSVRDVFGADVPHYFRHLYTDEHSVAPQVQYASGLDGPDPKCVVSIIGCTGDWFGGWDGDNEGDPNLCITEDLTSGRVVDVIARGEPAIMVCHWPGIYFNGREVGFNIFKEVVRRLHAKYDNLIWMTNGEIARYWAARELTRIERRGRNVTLQAPFTGERFTLSVTAPGDAVPKLTIAGKPKPLVEVSKPSDLKPGTWTRQGGEAIVCFDLPKGTSKLEV
jgi:hypothetical protein